MTIIKAQMAGTMWKVLVKEGQQIAVDEEIAIIESMKMEIPVESEVAGTVTKVFVAENDFIDVDDPLFEIEEA